MIDLNLLSKSRQAAIRGRIFFSLIERFMVTLVIVSLVLTLVLLSMKIRLSDNLSTIQSRQVLSTEYVTVNNEITNLNRSVARIEKIQKEVVPASLLIEDLANRAPQDVTIAFLNFEVPTLSAKIKGFAKTRESLLFFEGALLDSPYITELESPLSNLFEKENLDFSFNAILDIDTLRLQLDVEDSPEPATL